MYFWAAMKRAVTEAGSFHSAPARPARPARALAAVHEASTRAPTQVAPAAPHLARVLAVRASPGDPAANAAANPYDSRGLKSADVTMEKVNIAAERVVAVFFQTRTFNDDVFWGNKLVFKAFAIITIALNTAAIRFAA